MYGTARVAPDGVFVDDRKVADLEHILVERLVRSDLVSVVEIAPTGVGAQQAVTSFAELRALVKPGDTIRVTDTSGKTTTGKLGQLSASDLELLVAKEEPDKRITFVAQPPRSERDVREIRVERPDPLWNGILIGAASGLPLGTIPGGISGGCYSKSCHDLAARLALAGVGIGAGLGAAIDWARRGQATIYLAPGQRTAGVRVSPLLSKSAAGVQMSMRF